MGTMGVKLNTKTFGQTVEKPTSTNSTSNNLSAEDMKKLGGEDVGSVLNKIADANWVDPAKKMRTVGNDKLDKDAFFKLMMAQLKNQDPTNPLKPHEMSSHLANFSSLEQMQNMNQTLLEMKNGQRPMEQFQALNLIGKAVTGDSSKLVRAKGDKDHDFPFTLPMAAAEVSVRIRNSEGETVRTYELKNLKAGENRIKWNGLNDKNETMPPDEYSFFVEGKAANGQKIAVKTSFDGVITGVNYTPEGPVLLVGNQTIRLKDVRKIVDPSLMKNDQKMSDVTSQDLKAGGAVPQTEESKATEATLKPQAAVKPESKPEEGAQEAKKSNITNNVAFSREMMDKVMKETKPGG